MRRALVFLLLCSTGFLGPAWGQCPATDFSSAAAACRNQQLTLTNTSVPGTYNWDFCTGDLNLTPTGQLDFTLAGVNGRPGIELAFDTKWYAFVTSTFNYILYRVEFDNGLQSPPTSTTNLGDLGGTLNQPGQLRIVQEGSQWFAILHNTTGELLKLSFGTQLSNVPIVTTLITGVGSTNSGLAVGKDPVHGYVCVLSNSANQFSIIRLGPSLSVPNPVTDVLSSSAVPNPNNLGDLDIINVCGSWYGIADNLGNGNVYRLNFGTSLFSVPSITQIQTVASANPGRLRWAKEGEEYFFLMMTLDGTLNKGVFGTDITSVPVIVPEGNIGGVLTASMYGLAMVKENSTWNIMGVNQANGKVYKVNYSDNCSATPKSSMLTNPMVSYASSGTNKISLETTTASGRGAKTRSITISALDAPDIDFSSQNNCALNNVLFTSANLSGNLVTYAWNFGDSQTSPAPNPSHPYAAAGNYTAALTVTASNGCTNFVTRPLTIYDAPAADFTLPLAAPICTHQAYAFSNISSFTPGSNPTWEWRINGSLVSNSQDLSAEFLTAVPQEIRLKAIIPGCESEVIKNIATVLVGPTVSFSFANECVLTQVDFLNATTGADAGFRWDFGDGSPISTLAAPQHAYNSTGVYQVALTGSNVAGCQNQTIQQITIHSLPQPDFSVGLPPFSCSNTPTPFQNNTPALTDSNITGWLWNFGDISSASSTLQTPSFTYTTGGNYSVSLTATSEFGCENTAIKAITIGSSPMADFVQGPSCLNKPTQFNDISSGGVQTRVWQIASGTFGTPNPTYTFNVPGSYTATLTVTAAGGCSSMTSRPVIVPVPPSQIFNTTNPCEDQPAIFTDATNTAADPVVGWNWNADGNSLTGNPASYTFPTNGTFNVKMTTTHASGCQYTLSNNVAIHPSPVADFLPSPDRGAPPLTVEFENLSTGATQYIWLFNSTPPGTSIQMDPVYTFLDLGDYTAQLTAVNIFGCADTHTEPIVVLVPSVDLVLSDFVISPDAITGKLKSTITIVNNSNVPLATAEVALHLSDKAVVSELVSMNLAPGLSVSRTLSFTFSPEQFGAQFVCAELLSELDNTPDNNKRCLSLTQEDYIFAPYPNPSSGNVQIDWIAEKTGSARITVYNSMGRREYEWETPSVPGLNQSVHDLSFLSAGMYFITVQTSSTLQTQRFLRQ